MAENKPKWPHKGKCTMGYHASGQWCKRIDGKLRYFGTDADAALRKYLSFAADLHAGHLTPTTTPATTITVGTLVNTFLTRKDDARKAGELSNVMYGQYLRLGRLIVGTFGRDATVAGLTPSHFSQLRSQLAPSASKRASEVVWTRSFFKSAIAQGIPVRMEEFKKPPAKQLRKERRLRGGRMYQPWEVRRILRQSGPALRAIVMLAANAGFGAMDCSNLKRSDVDLDTGMIDTIREKTEVARKFPLWRETVTSLRAYVRPAPSDEVNKGRFFLTELGNALTRDNVHLDSRGEVEKVVRADRVANLFADACKAAHVKCRGFYALRHSFKTWADSTLDTNAIAVVAGHKLPGMDENYVEKIDPARLRAVVNAARRQLFRRGPGSPEWSPIKQAGARRAGDHAAKVMPPLAAG